MLIKTKLFGNGKLPEYKTKGAACADCYARLEDTENDEPFKFMK